MTSAFRVLVAARSPESVRSALRDRPWATEAFLSAGELLEALHRGGADAAVLDVDALGLAAVDALLPELISSGIATVAILSDLRTAVRCSARGVDAVLDGVDARLPTLLDRLLLRAAERRARETHVAELEQAVSLMRQRLGDHNAFERARAHELRTPVAIMSGFAHNLADGVDGPLSADARTSVLAIVRAATQLTALLDDRVKSLTGIPAISDAAVEQANRDRRRAARTAVDLGEILRATQALFSLAAERASAHLTVEVEPGLPQVWMDRSRLTQVLTNLVSNALKYGGPNISLRASLAAGSERRGQWAALSVLDDGPGLSPEEVERVFERYARGSTATHVPGEGIGLAVCQSIVRQHGGRIHARPGPGGQFVVELPVDLRARRGGSTIMIVEDPAVVEALVARVPTAPGGGGPRIVRAHDLSAALEVIHADGAALILADHAALDAVRALAAEAR